MVEAQRTEEDLTEEERIALHYLEDAAHEAEMKYLKAKLKAATLEGEIKIGEREIAFLENVLIPRAKGLLA